MTCHLDPTAVKSCVNHRQFHETSANRARRMLVYRRIPACANADAHSRNCAAAACLGTVRVATRGTSRDQTGLLSAHVVARPGSWLQLRQQPVAAAYWNAVRHPRVIGGDQLQG